MSLPFQYVIQSQAQSMKSLMAKQCERFHSYPGPELYTLGLLG